MRCLTVKAGTWIDRHHVPWHAAVTSHSFATLLATMRQAPAVSVFPECALPNGARILSGQDGFPALPQVEVALYCASGASVAIAQLARFLDLKLRMPT